MENLVQLLAAVVLVLLIVVLYRVIGILRRLHHRTDGLLAKLVDTLNDMSTAARRVNSVAAVLESDLPPLLSNASTLVSNAREDLTPAMRDMKSAAQGLSETVLSVNTKLQAIDRMLATLVGLSAFLTARSRAARSHSDGSSVFSRLFDLFQRKPGGTPPQS